MLIKESTSPFASNLVLVRMTEMSLRFYVDYSVLNSKTIKNAHAIFRVEEALEALGVLLGFQLVTYILYIGKWRWSQTPGTCSVYSRNLSHWEFARMPFRLTNAPASFQCMMQYILQVGNIHLRFCVISIDDCIIFIRRESFVDHVNNMNQAFARIRDHGLTMVESLEDHG